MRHGVGLVPGELLGQHVLRSRGLDDLRQRGGVAERVGQPDLLGLDPEVLQEEPLPGHELPGHRLAARHVGVRLDPHPTDRQELTRRHLLGDPGEQLGIVLLHPRVLLGRRAGEFEGRVGIGQRDHVGERPGALADRLANRPQPGRVDVGVADGHDPVGAGVRRPGEDLGQLGPPRRGGAGHVAGIDDVDHPRQGLQDLGPARLVLRQGAHQAVEGEHVLQQLPDAFVPQTDVKPPQGVERCAAGGREVAVRGGVEVGMGHVGVGRGLDVQVHRSRQDRGHVVVQRGDRLDDRAVRPVRESLGLKAGAGGEPEVDDQFDRRAVRQSAGRKPGRRNLSGDVQPGRPPGPAPVRADLDRTVRLLHRFAERHRLTRCIPAGHRHRRGIAVHSRLEVVSDEALQTVLEHRTLVVHRHLLHGSGRRQVNPGIWSAPRPAQPPHHINHHTW